MPRQPGACPLAWTRVSDGAAAAWATRGVAGRIRRCRGGWREMPRRHASTDVGVGWRRGGTGDQGSASSDSGRRGGGLQQRLTPTLMATGAPAPAPTRLQGTTSSSHPSSSSPPKSSTGVAEREEAPCTQAPWPCGSLAANRSEQRTRGGEGRVGEGQPRRRRAKLDVATLDASVAGRGGEGRQEAA